MATPTKVGFEFLVNSDTDGVQGRPDIVALADGRWLAVWDDPLPPPPGGQFGHTGISGQYFNASGSANGSPFTMVDVPSPFATAGAGSASVASLQAGGFAIGWEAFDEGLPLQGRSVFVAGTQVESQGVNIGAGTPEVVQLADGKLASVWFSRDQGENNKIEFRLTNSSGSYVNFGTVSTLATSDHTEPSIAALSDGGFVVAWSATDTNGDATILAQRYTSNGAAVGTNVTVPVFAAGNQTNPQVVGLSDGKFVVVYEDTSHGYGSIGISAIVARVFNNDGTPLQDFQIHGPGLGTATAPAITALPDGRFFVAWVDSAEASWEPTFQGTSIAGRLFKLDGGSYVADGNRVNINTYYNGDQLAPTLTTTIDGRIIVAWQTYSGALDGSGSGISAQILDPREQGSTWNATLPASQFVGSAYSDVLLAFEDTVFIGGGGFDTVIAKTADFNVNVGAGTTLFQVEQVILAGGNNLVNGSYSSDFLYLYGGGGGSTNTLKTGSGGGYMISAGGVNDMFGGGGTNVFVGGIGQSDMHGGSGYNVYYTSAVDKVYGAGTYNTEVLLTQDAHLTYGINMTNVQMVILNGGSNFVDLAGSTQFSYLYGGGAGSENWLLLGGGGGYALSTGGTNHMYGGLNPTASSIFVGGIGVSDMHGGSGVNTYYVGDADTVFGAGVYNNLIELTHGVTRVLGSAGLTNVQRFILAGGDNIVDASAATQQIFIYAAAGNDRIGAGAGNDQLWGYGGANTFVFMNNWGDDIINDWSSGIGNKLDLTALASAGVHAISDLTISIAAGSTIVEYGTSSITVYGHTGLTTSDFLFA